MIKRQLTRRGCRLVPNWILSLRRLFLTQLDPNKRTTKTLIATMPKRSHQQHQPDGQKRQRVYAACSNCRRRRRKCDGKTPCSSCDKFGYDCIYDVQKVTNGVSSAINKKSAPQSETQNSPSDPLPTNIVINKERCRFVAAHSAIALPHLVGRELNSDNPPRLHSFAWNLGLRPERRRAIGASLSDYITTGECRKLSARYFEAVHPFFCFLSEESYYSRLEENWPNLEREPNFAAVVAGVCALGSFFSTVCHEREDDLKHHCFSILDLELSILVVSMNMDSVAGWILRTLYTRLTTRPAISSAASHMAMHMVDVLSLHRDISDNVTIRISEKSIFTAAEIQTRRRHYWVACYLNSLVTAEYGLSPVKLNNPNCATPVAQPGTHVEEMIALNTILQSIEDACKQGLGSKQVSDLFVDIHNVRDSAPIVSLFKADTCLCVLRRFIVAAQRPSSTVSLTAMSILEKALEAVSELMAASHTWWNMLSIPFHTICVCISMDTRDYLTLLPTAMERLRNLADAFNSHMAKEALSTAQALVSLSRGKTDEKLKFKDSALSHTAPSDNIWMSLDPDFNMLDGWPLGLDFMQY